jgi:23S rRNA pseudouridine2605 synthase
MDDKHEPHKSGERIAKVIARAGLGSRREVEAWIAAGRVAVNGAAIASPALNVSARDRITVDGEPLPERERTRLFLYSKPRGLVSTRTDPQGRPTVFDRLPKHLPRLISIGRLDYNTEGLLLLTNDGGLARVLELPATGWLRRYRVRAHGAVTQAALDPLRSGVTVDGVRYGPIEATLDRAQGSNVWLTFAIREGKNREVRNVLGHLDLAVTRLIRVSFGPFQLGELADGEVEEIKTRVLREQLGERIVAQSGADFSAAISHREEPTIQSDVRHPEVRAQRAAQVDESRLGHSQFRNRVNPISVDDGPSAAAVHPSRAASRPPRDDGSKVGARPARKPERPHASHAWREHKIGGERDKPLRRTFRGARRAEKEQREQAATEKRAGLLTDRKGRRVLVERFASARTAEPPPEPQKRGPPKRGRRGRPDRAAGPRPARPRPKRR